MRFSTTMSKVLTCSVVWVLVIHITGFSDGHSLATTIGWTHCPDNTVCPRGQTCLPLWSGSYGCCPYQEASECSDGLHCCPQGYHCLVSSGTCVGGNATVAMVRTHPSIEGGAGNTMCTKPSTVKCPNQQTCPEGTKCCKDDESFEFYYCCRYENGHCCPGGTLCCDEGYRCDVSQQLCHSNVSHEKSAGGVVRRVDSSPKTSLRAQPPKEARTAKMVEFKQCPDGTSCYHDSSCCAGAKGSFACCPFVTSERCQDEKLCCPEGFNYNATGQNCVNGEHVIPAARKYPTFIAPKVTIDTSPSVPCPSWMICDSQSCCVSQYGEYRCCPYTNGVCCSDGISGCPPGDVCAFSVPL